MLKMVTTVKMVRHTYTSRSTLLALVLSLCFGRCSGNVVAGSIISRPPFSWETLPVFFHSANSSGSVWSDAAAKQITRFSMATFEKAYGMRLPNGSTRSEEVAGPEACRLIQAATPTGKTPPATFFYLNSVIDWPFNRDLHSLMVSNPTWRVTNTNGAAVMVRGQFGYNMTNDAMRARWVKECVDAVKQGCTGCFIDQANMNEYFPGVSQAALADYNKAHRQSFKDLSDALSPTGNYALFNHLAVPQSRGLHAQAMMIEDFVGSENCIARLQTTVARGYIIEARAGHFVDCGPNALDTSSLAAFLIGAGNFSYYHCATTWSSDPEWPNVRDAWLDWLPAYDIPLGEPLTPGAKGKDGIWRRSFRSGTRVSFDPSTLNGTIAWGAGVTYTGHPVANQTLADIIKTKGCAWESMLHEEMYD